MRARILTVGLAAVGLSACGFHPLYGTSSIPEGAAEAFAAIEVEPIPATNDSDEIGALLTSALNETLHKPGLAVDTKAVLKIDLADERKGLAIQNDASITRYNYRLTADWSLTRVGQDRPYASGEAQTIASYNVVDQQYATLVARRDAEQRAAKEVAEQIKLNLATKLMTPAS